MLLIIIVYAFFSFNINYFYRTISGWALLGEEGSHLAYVQSILSGGVYGRDFSSPYGPMMIYPIVWLMKIFGTTLFVARLYTYLLNIVAHGFAIFLLYRILRSKIIFFLASMIYFLPAPQWSYLRVILGFLPIFCAYRYLQVQKTYLLVIGGGVLGQVLLFSQEVGISCLLSLFFLFLMYHLLIESNWKRLPKEVLSVFIGLVGSAMPLLIYFYLKEALLPFLANIYEHPKCFAMGYGSLPFPNFKDFLSAPSAGMAWFAYWIIFMYIISAIYLISQVRLGYHYPDYLFKVSILIFGVVLFRSALVRSDGHHIHFVSPPAFFLAFFFMDNTLRNFMKHSFPILRVGNLLLGTAILASILFLFSSHNALKANYDFVKSEVLHYRQKWHLTKNDQRFIGLERGAVLFDPETVQTLTKIYNFVQANTGPCEYVYFFPNEAAYYFFFDRPNPTRYPAVYQAMTKEHRHELIEDLEKRKPVYVFYSQATARIDGIPEDIQVPEVVAYLHKEYDLYLDLKDILILKRIRS